MWINTKTSDLAAVLELSSDRDWLAWVVDIAQIFGALASAVAIVLALRSIKISRDQSAEADRRLVRERRIDYELGVLRDVALTLTRGSNVAFAGAELGVHAACLGPRVVPLVCAMPNQPSTAEAESRIAEARAQMKAMLSMQRPSSVWDLLRDELQGEVLDQITLRVERSDRLDAGDRAG
ncbi:hypothetical protein [Kineosporia babensis]|uniref:Uncharacterized protein n=1 Tax=Kineosporia babensis TaxID=499548 RepID=A0A9X1NM80_9ACTN|nr:hypothetical protein [Kineosporia babensis]MCD5316144.1 hypothetical protein [Kineosporia babensis]